jgi:hypothetical protein
VTEPLEVNSPEWWAEHGVGDEVRAARPYVRWTTDDLEPVRAAYAGLSAGQLRTLIRWARQSDGLVIYRHSFEKVPVGEYRYVYPEIRPDQAIRTKTVCHHHGTAASGTLLDPRSGNPLRPEHVHSPDSMERHIARDRAPDDHGGVNTDAVHCHDEMAKYLFPPSATMTVPWVHSHRDEYFVRVHVHLFPGVDEHGEWIDPEMSEEERQQLEDGFVEWLKRHVRARHPGVDAARLAKDVTEDYALHEHSVRVKRADEQLAKRIDVNPLVWEHGGFEDAKRVFFGIEGCIKADAILTALLRAGQPPAVFSVPSVSLWEATYPAIANDSDDTWLPADDDEAEDSTEDSSPEFVSYQGDELAAFANRYLLGKLVCIVPDADAHTKPEVMTQALLCRSTLRRLGTHAEIVLPPNDRIKEGIKGIDDFLGKGRGKLEDCVWYRKEPPAEDRLEEWLLRARSGTWRRDGLQRAAQTLQALATHAADNGEYSASIRLLARATGGRKLVTERAVDVLASEPPDARALEAARKKFERGITDLLETEAITTNKPLSVRVERWLRGVGGWRKQTGLHWAEDDAIITVNCDLRAVPELRGISELS